MTLENYYLTCIQVLAFEDAALKIDEEKLFPEALAMARRARKFFDEDKNRTYRDGIEYLSKLQSKK